MISNSFYTTCRLANGQMIFDCHCVKAVFAWSKKYRLFQKKQGFCHEKERPSPIFSSSLTSFECKFAVSVSSPTAYHPLLSLPFPKKTGRWGPSWRPSNEHGWSQPSFPLESGKLITSATNFCFCEQISDTNHASNAIYRHL